jgi:phosphoribosylformimino-5-aminoimidazole carboxamide ribotide isomerase
VDECEEWLKGGIYRIFLHDLIQRDPDGVRSLLERYGPSRVCAGAITRDGHISPTWRPLEESDTVAFALRARELGIRRVFFTDRNYEGVLRGPNFDELRRLAEETHMQITAAGGVATVEHLWMLQEMECIGVDSVVVGRAFYENCFPCQQLWRDIEADRKKGGNGWTEGVSTSTLVDNGHAAAPRHNGGADQPAGAASGD